MIYFFTVEELFSRIIILIGINLFLIGIFILYLLIKIKLKKADFFSVIELFQQIINLMCCVFIWGIFSVGMGVIFWGCLYFIMRLYIFKNNARRLQELYEQENLYKIKPPSIQHIIQLRKVFFSPRLSTKNMEFKYNIGQHINGLASLLILWCLGMIDISVCCYMHYCIEFLVIATACFVFIGKFVYHISLWNANSLWYLSPRLSYIPVVFTGIIYYFVVIIILTRISPF